MDAPIEAYMKVGIVHFMAFPDLSSGKGPWEETVSNIALDPFFTAIEITHIDDPEVREGVRAMIHLAHLAVGFGAHPTILGQQLNINALNERDRINACTVLKAQIKEAISMGSESFVVLSGKDPGAKERSDAVRALVRSLEDLCAYSDAREGPAIVAEVFDCDVDKCCLLGPSSLAREVAQEVTRKHRNFGLLVDLSHIPLLKETPAEALGPVREYLTGAHLGNAVTDRDYPGYGDNHPFFGIPGGANDTPQVAEFLKTLLEIGFLNGEQRPIVSFEIKPMQDQNPLVLIANAKRVLREAWAMI